MTPRAASLVLAPAPARPLAGTLLAGLRIGLAGLAGFCAVLACAITVPGLVWHATFTVLSGSMTPTLRVGDVVVERRVAPLEVRIGDVVTFPDPDGTGRLFTHRVVGMSARDGAVAFVTRGDANTGVERWSVTESGRLGRVVYRVPLAGFVTDRAGSRFGRLGLVVVPALLLALVELRRIWRKDRS